MFTAFMLSVTGIAARLHLVIYLLLSVLALPCGLFLIVQWNDHSDRMKARELDAVLPPRVADKSIGGRNIMRTMIDNFQRGYFGENFTEWSRTHGPVFNLRIMFENRMFTTEPEHIKNILSTNFSGFEKGEQLEADILWLLIMSHVQAHTFVSNSVLSWEPEYSTWMHTFLDDLWKFHRGISRPFFTKERVSNVHGYAQHSTRAIQLLTDRLQSGYPVDFQDLASRYTLDWATDFLFGVNVGSLTSTLPYPEVSGMNVSRPVLTPVDAFVRGFSAAETAASMRTRFGPIWPLLELRRDRVEHDMAPVYAFVEPIITTALERNRSRSPEAKVSNAEDLTFLDYLIQHTQDMTVLRDATLNMLVAGRDTTMFLLSASIYGLAENPPVLSRLRTEVLNALGTTGIPTIKELRTLKYMRAVLNETMRMWPPVPINIRKSKEAAAWAPVAPGQKPICVPARTNTQSVPADTYDPDRFLEDDERYNKYLAPNPWIFLPFNGGPRMCLGSEVAYDQAAFFLIRLLQSFSEITLAAEATPADCVPTWKGREKVWFMSHITMYYKGGLWVRMKRADSDD
ncbi:Cytochrome P450 monooxygenase pc-3 [Mycena venus]|uniref:Cytochrome P450 monooxygenase pc-3 n=1 Tax=Mycena venus TaxID=2733690 RepID=A0A8H6X740_9AGAR|nr:Cytochrome P450 monooxygenase pc-3 [Mycena venus]